MKYHIRLLPSVALSDGVVEIKQGKIPCRHPSIDDVVIPIKESDIVAALHKGTATLINNQNDQKHPYVAYRGKIWQKVGSYYSPIPEARDVYTHYRHD